MRLTVLVCALTCLLIAPHAYAEGDSGAVADWLGTVALAVSLLSVVIAVCQLGAARATYQAQTFLDMTQRMREFRDVRRMLHLVGSIPDCEWERYVEEDRIRDYLAFLNASAFLSDTRGVHERCHSPEDHRRRSLYEWWCDTFFHRNALPREWILELWAPTIKATLPGAECCIRKWKKEERESGKRLFDHFEKLADECRRYEAAKDSQADS